MKYIVDRIEGQFAVCEDEEEHFVDIPLEKLYHGIKEGDHILFLNDVYSHDLASEQKAREEMAKLQNSLFEN